MDIVNYLIWYLAIVSQSFYNKDYNRTHKLSIDNNEYGQLSNMVSSNNRSGQNKC